MDDYLEESAIELTPEMKKEMYGVSKKKKLSISKILMITSVVIIVLIVVNIWSGVQKIEVGIDQDLQGELFQEKGMGGEIDLEINNTNETSQNNSFTNSSE